MKHEKKEGSLPLDIKLAPKYYAVYCSKHALSRSMLDIGLYYKPNKLKVRNNNVARLEKIRDYLISLYALINIEKEGTGVLIYLDE